MIRAYARDRECLSPTCVGGRQTRWARLAEPAPGRRAYFPVLSRARCQHCPEVELNEALKTELEQMRELDQSFRLDAMRIAKEQGPTSDEYIEIRDRGRAMDERHVARLREILDEHGWPGLALVGELACSGAFLILQHADPETQKLYVPLLREATAAGESPSAMLPLLEDRILMRDGEKQIYGTQIARGEDGKPALWPIADEDGVEERRARVGLEPLGEYVKRFGMTWERGGA